MKDFLEHLIMPEQRSLAWHEQRKKRVTSSDMHRLMEDGERPMTEEEKKKRPKKGAGSKTTWTPDPSILSKTALTYIEEVIAFYLTGVPNDSGSAATLWGEEHEEEGKRHFESITGFKIKEIGFVPFSTIAGGTTDGDIESEDATFELKCPKNSAIHLRYVRTLTAENMKVLQPDFYYQCQSNMLWTKRSKAYFASYDPRMPEALKMKIILLHADLTEQTRILHKADLAAKEINKALETLNNTIPWEKKD